MLYDALRTAARIALDWYYADIIVHGRDRVPRDGPLLIVANHPNALIDALVISTTMGRRVRLTAKATLFEHRMLAPLLNVIGVVPLRRAKDERAAQQHGAPSTTRNTDAFRLVTDALRAGQVVLVFPEGISHDDPALAPLKTGAARMALEASDAGARALQVLPVGLVFEEKERPRSRLLVRVGDAIDLDMWRATSGPGTPLELTHEIDVRLRRVTLNFASADRAARAVSLARTLAAIANPPPALGRPQPLAVEAEIARRIEAATEGLTDATPDLAARAEELSARVEALVARLAERGVQISDVQVSARLRHGLRFAIREGLLAVIALPVALLGRVTHQLPLRLARRLALGSLANDPSRDQPAMRTIVLGLVLVCVWFALQGVVVASLVGWLAAVAWLIVVFGAARADLLLRDRLARAARRARTFFAIRRDPAFRERALAELHNLLAAALDLEQALIDHGATASGPARSAIELEEAAADHPDPSARPRAGIPSVDP